jgi:hypothetical protein
MGVSEFADAVSMLIEQSEVHIRNGSCIGLPFCVSCRASALLNNGLNTLVAEAWINSQAPGTVVRWKPKQEGS